MIPRSQHFGDRAPFPSNRPGIVRIFQEILLEALLLSAGGRAHYPGEQSYASVEDHHRSKLATGQDIVANGDRLDRSSFEDSLIESLETATQQDDPFACGQIADPRLRERGAPRRQREHWSPVRNIIERGGEHVRA